MVRSYEHHNKNQISDAVFAQRKKENINEAAREREKRNKNAGKPKTLLQQIYGKTKTIIIAL